MNGYEMVIGLETHIELKTKSKIFCSCSTAFGAAPNTQVCPVCTGMPGTLPVLNAQAVDYAVTAGLATNCTIASFSKLDRKNYFYPDLPKAYQISQYDLPLCSNGYLTIETPEGEKRIGITRIHIEEDAGKLIHGKEGTYIDFNRCGVPLIEVVSEPDLRSAAEVKAYLQKLRAIMLYIGVSDCRMNEGSLRCDVNLSVRKKGEQAFGTRCEMKNLNSFVFITKAIEYEFRRQCELLEHGGRVEQETRRFDQATGKTYSMRSKEEADDYRYFPDPDLPPIEITPQRLERLRSAIPQLPDKRKQDYIRFFGLPSSCAELLVSDKYVADYFEQAAPLCRDKVELANLITGEIFRLMGENNASVIPVSPAHLAKAADMASEGEINRGTAKKLIAALWEENCDPAEYVRRHNLRQINDPDTLTELCRKAVEQNPQALRDYLGGKQAALQALLGKAMGLASGQANPALLRQKMDELLKEQAEDK